MSLSDLDNVCTSGSSVVDGLRTCAESYSASGGSTAQVITSSETSRFVGLIWVWQVLAAALPQGENVLETDEASWIEPWNALMSDFRARIGELPYKPGAKRRRHRWPWETQRRRHSMELGNGIASPRQAYPDATDTKHPISPSLSVTKDQQYSRALSSDGSYETADDFDTERLQMPPVSKLPLNDSTRSSDRNYDSVPLSSLQHPDDDDNLREKDICIGSIFGLDVGGTLAKLIYFKPNPSKLKPLANSHLDLHMGSPTSGRRSRLTPSIQTSRSESSTASTKPTSMSTFRITGEVLSPFDATARPKLTRSRSLSLGCMARFKEFAMDDPENDLEDKPSTPQHKSTKLEGRRKTYRPMLSMGTSMDLADSKKPAVYTKEHKVNAFSKTKVSFAESEGNTSDDDEYFQESPLKNGDPPDLPSAPSQRKSRSISEPRQPGSRLISSKSMIDLTSRSQQKAAALDKFYNFAKSLDAESHVADHHLRFYSRELGGEFHFLRFESRRLRHTMDLIRLHNLHLNISKMGATGGGAHKYADEFDQLLGIYMDKQEELDSLVAGMQFVLATVVGECYTFWPNNKPPTTPGATSGTATPDEEKPISIDDTLSDDELGAPLSQDSWDVDHESKIKTTESTDKATKKARIDEWWWSRKVQRDAVSYSSAYPYMLVTIGTGVSILRVDGPCKHERISGSTIGGGTYWGLMRLLTDVEDFDDVLTLAEKGDPGKVDMMVGDIYGSNSDALEKLGLPSNIVASSFGKLVAKEDPAAGLEQEDLARALLLMITNNIGQVAYLNAKLHKTRRIFFVGNFLRSNVISQRRLSFAINYWSKGEMEALFLEHEGYFGALGAFLMSQNISQDEEGFFQWDQDKVSSGDLSSTADSNSRQSNYIHRRRQTFDT
eukprot:Nitzschia sp. Nitz4//scaffold349_size16934//8509//11235//NITZ4_008848-RA/size16934-snap-gene-0.0-mRNA-1//1//CDS//3329548707//7465//frame0